MEFGLRWNEFDRNDRVITKEKFFETEQARERFVKKLEQKSSFCGIVGYSAFNI